MTLHTITITGTGAAVAVSATSILCSILHVATGANNAAAVLVGGPDVSSLIGMPIPKGTVVPIRASTDQLQAQFDLSQVKVFVGAGDTVTILWA